MTYDIIGWIFARSLAHAGLRIALVEKQDIGKVALLEKYERRHMRTTKLMFHGTNEIVKFFTDDPPPAKLARRVALRLANRIPPIRYAIQNKLTETSNRHSL